MFWKKKPAAAVCCALLAGGMLGTIALAAPDRFTEAAYANHWGRSDLRAYLNNGLADVSGDTVSHKNCKTDSIADSTNTSGYAQYFSDAEYRLMQPVTCSTALTGRDAGSTYETTDRLQLPCGNSTLGTQILSWGKEDISTKEQYAVSAAQDIQRLIPISYWSGGSGRNAWLRSANAYVDTMALYSGRGRNTAGSMVNVAAGVAPFFKIDLSGVRFAAAASAAQLAASGGAQRIDIAGSGEFGKETSADLPAYGMYLKTVSRERFEAMQISYGRQILTVGYLGGTPGSCIVVQAYREDDLAAGTEVYAAASGLSDSDWKFSILPKEIRITADDQEKMQGEEDPDLPDAEETSAKVPSLEKTAAVRTGDDSSILPWAALLCVSGGLAVLLVILVIRHLR